MLSSKDLKEDPKSITQIEIKLIPEPSKNSKK
jgi:hypothetical protein